MTPEEQNAFDVLRQQVTNLTLAFEQMSAFYEKHELWLREKGIWDDLVQDVLSRVPITNSGRVSTSPVVTPPSASYPIGAYKLPIRPLTNGEQRNAIDALVRGGYVDGATKIELDFTKGIYPLQDLPVVERVREVYWNTGTPAPDKAALLILLSAIDQRDMQTNAILAPSDPRVVPISGTLAVSGTTAPAGSPVSAQVVYSENLVMVNPETGFTISLGMSKNDDGLSVLYNYGFPWNNGATSNPKLPQMMVRMERNGGVSINGNAPQQDTDGNPIQKGPWDGLAGKDFEIFPLGFDRGDSQGKSQHVDVACLQAGRTLRLGASSATAKPTFPVEITAGEMIVNGRAL